MSSLRIQGARDRFRQLLTSLGRSGLHAMFPDEFENYAMSLELVNADGIAVDMLIFPVMPSEVRIAGRTLESIKKTSAGVVSLHTQTFVPYPISFSGTFGRKFRILLGDESIMATGISLFQRLKELNPTTYNVKIKTGYGVTKAFERIIKASRSVDQQGRSYKLVLSLQAFNLNVYAVVNDYSFDMQEQRNNMMWGYSATFTAIAPSYQNWQEQRSSLLKVASLGSLSRFTTNFITDNKSLFGA